MDEAIKYLGKYVITSLIQACEKETIYMWQNSILIVLLGSNTAVLLFVDSKSDHKRWFKLQLQE